jgi:aldehyde:ferredoxin oxidoreductase
MRTLNILADVRTADGKYFARCPRSILRRAVERLAEVAGGGELMVLSELEFYVFDKVRYTTEMNRSSYVVDSEEASWNSYHDEIPNLGYKLPRALAQHAAPPRDHLYDVRTDIVKSLGVSGVPVKYHHHEAGGPGQSEIEPQFESALQAGDHLQMSKDIIKTVAIRNGKTAAFMPKPLHDEAANGLHFHLCLKDGERSLFFEEGGYACLSQAALYAIGGLLHHTPALMAICNPSTNSYRRFAPGLAAPVHLFFAVANRSAALRIPAYGMTPTAQCIEYRMADAIGNPYLTLAAVTAAMADGIAGRISPSEYGFGPFEVNVYTLPEEEQGKMRQAPTSLEKALSALQDDSDFLIEGRRVRRSFRRRLGRPEDEERGRAACDQAASARVHAVLRSLKDVTAMPDGCNDCVAHIDLTTGTVELEHPGEEFFRKYLGGSLLAGFYLLRDMPPGADPLGPDNVLVFAPSVVTGVPLPGVSRFNVTAKSPLTGAIGDAQCSGHSGPQIKFTGFDAIVVHGRASSPVYLWIADGLVQIRDARHLASLEPKEAEEVIRRELGDERVQVVQNGLAGRLLVRFANVSNAMHHFAGRTGMGAVMGSKNPVALAARGKRTYSFADEDRVRDLARRVAEAYKNAPGFKAFGRSGTSMVVDAVDDLGGLPTHNMSEGVFPAVDGIKTGALHDSIFVRRDTCAYCSIRCKRVVTASEPWPIDEAYGGPEHETTGMLGSNVGVGDIRAVANANELCNRYGLDTISTGGMIAFAMECFENGLLGVADTDGLELRFGSPEALLEMVRRIGEREGLGDLLADGFDVASAAIWPESAKYAMHVKGLAIPAHMPQIKQTQALAYAVSPWGADHISSEHDSLLEACGIDCVALGIESGRPWHVLDDQKVRYVAYTQYFYSIMDTLELCTFLFSPGALYSYRDIGDLVEAVCGLPGNLWFLMKAGERRVNLLRAFNYREGLTRQADALPLRVFDPLTQGPQRGARVRRRELARALRTYYEIMGWGPRTGRPRGGKLKELGLGWVGAALDEHRRTPTHV